MADELCSLSAVDAAERLGRRQLSPVELVGAVLERIERLQPVLNAFITVCAERALEEARRAEAAILRGERRGPLHGLPFSAKDLVDTAGVRTTYGSRIHAAHVPREDAVAVARLRAAGAILVGKTTTPEFGHKPLTDAPLFGRTPNVWSPALTAGGSSGGAAVAVVAGMGPLAVATDGGGSTRIPAACNGAVGFKQSLGVVPHSQAPDAFGNLTYVTPMTRTVADTVLMLQAMSGADASDPWSYVAVPDVVAAGGAGGDLRGVRVGWTTLLGNTRVARDVAAATRRAASVLESLGAAVDELREPLESTEPIWTVINHATWRARFASLVASHRGIMSETLVRQVEGAGAVSAEAFQRAAFARTELFRTIQSWFTRCDVIVTPTLSRTAVAIDHDLFAPIEIDGEPAGAVRGAWYPYTLPFNLTGHPAVSVPAGVDGGGLPIGLQLVGRFRGDAELLRIAALYEEATRSPVERPPAWTAAGA